MDRRQMQMKLAIILLAAVTLALFFVSGIVASKYGPTVSARRFERGMAYDATELRRWINEHRGEARGYARLIPLCLWRVSRALVRVTVSSPSFHPIGVAMHLPYC